MTTNLAKAKMRVLLTFDIDAESAQVRKSPHLPVSLSKGQFARVGVARILGLLDTFGIQATFFTPAWTAEHYADLVRGVVAKGHEIAAHGDLHENFSEMDDVGEEAVHEKSVRVLEAVAGRRPTGFRAPYWEWSTRTGAFLRKYGFAYDSSLMNDDRPYAIPDGSAKGIVELPVDWVLDDWMLFEEKQQPPSAALETWRSEFDASYELGTGYFILAMHPECIGRGYRMRVLEQLVRHMRTKKGVAFGRCDEVAASVRKSA
jgi:peptidoglycan-N-acetylglucosamine deacetylase